MAETGQSDRIPRTLRTDAAKSLFRHLGGLDLRVNADIIDALARIEDEAAAPPEPPLPSVEQMAAALWFYDVMPQEMGEGDCLVHWNDTVFPTSKEVKAMYRNRASLLLNELRALHEGTDR